MFVQKLLPVVVVPLGLFVLSQSSVAAHESWPPLFAVLDGGNEVSTEGIANAGDQDGRGGFTAVIQGNELCYGLTVAAICYGVLEWRGHRLG